MYDDTLLLTLISNSSRWMAWLGYTEARTYFPQSDLTQKSSYSVFKYISQVFSLLLQGSFWWLFFNIVYSSMCSKHISSNIHLPPTSEDTANRNKVTSFYHPPTIKWILCIISSYWQYAKTTKESLKILFKTGKEKNANPGVLQSL